MSFFLPIVGDILVIWYISSLMDIITEVRCIEVYRLIQGLTHE